VSARAGTQTCRVVAVYLSTDTDRNPPGGAAAHTTTTAWRLAANWFKSW